MTSDTVAPAESTRDKNAAGTKPERLYYIDWLQVLAVLGVFLFHATLPFSDLVDWHIKNAEKNDLVTLLSVFFSLWGMPFFFFMAGVTSWFSLRRRTAGRYVRERFTHLLIPFIVGVIVLTPIMAYYDMTHRGWWKGGSFVEFLRSSEVRTDFSTEYHALTPGPESFGQLGYHLWFVAFLFIYALLALPLFAWLKQEAGQRFTASLARLAKWRGGLLVFVVPLILIRFAFQPFFSSYTGWADFFTLLVFYVSGYIFIANERFMRAIRRDRYLYLILGIACTLFFFSVVADVPVLDWMGSPGTPEFYVTWILFSINSWCWTMIMINVGMRFLDTPSKWLTYSRQASFPFFWLHFAVVFFVAYHVVQWEVDLLIKLLVVVIGSFLMTLGIIELLIKPFNPMRRFFGMKPKRRKDAAAPPAAT